MSAADVEACVSSESPQPSAVHEPEVPNIEGTFSEFNELEQVSAESLQQGSNLWLYRERIVGLLIEVGRLPSLLGTTRVSSYSARTFEDAVISVHDVEHCLQDLNDVERRIIGKVVFQDYTHDAAAQLLRCGRRTITRRFSEILDLITEEFFEHGLLCRFSGANADCSRILSRG